MESEHPIPQEVSTYQFKLVGDMTIQQFMQVAGGAIVSLVIYSTNLAGYVKWPLIIVSFLVGVAFAFFPIEDRPLSKWLVLFIKAIYSPTVYVWNKNAVKHYFFQPETATEFADAASGSQVPTVQQTPVSINTQAPAPPSLATTDQEESDKLEQEEKKFLNKVNQEFATPQNPIDLKSVKAAIPPSQKVSVPQTQQVGVGRMDKEKEQTSSGDIFASKSDVGGTITPIAGGNITNTKSAVFSPEAAPPSPPTRPNVVVGQVLDGEGKIVDGAILEIKDSEGRSVRALRTNRLGHFMIVTPLIDGKYEITTDKDGYVFDPVSLNIDGRILAPIAITGKKST